MGIWAAGGTKRWTASVSGRWCCASPQVAPISIPISSLYFVELEGRVGVHAARAFSTRMTRPSARAALGGPVPSSRVLLCVPASRVPSPGKLTFLSNFATKITTQFGLTTNVDQITPNHYYTIWSKYLGSNSLTISLSPSAGEHVVTRVTDVSCLLKGIGRLLTSIPLLIRGIDCCNCSASTLGWLGRRARGDASHGRFVRARHRGIPGNYY